MKKIIASLILKIFGWKIVNKVGDEILRSVIILAPHTSNLDFFLGIMVLWKWKIPSHYLIKKEAFIFPMKRLLKSSGAIAVDRKKPGYISEHVALLFQENKKIAVVITPEGTRSLVNQWKKGFYYIATSGQVPISLAFIDYKYKTAGVGDIIHPSGDYNKDLEKINLFYKNIHARNPENFNLSCYKQKDLKNINTNKNSCNK